jgi:type VI secretion system protein VasD
VSGKTKAGSALFAARALGVLAVAALPIGFAVSIMASCAQREIVVQAPKQCELQVVTLTVLASPFINPTDQGAARPVQLRIYQLKSTIRMENASFESIWKKDKDTLQDDLVKVDELSIYPDSRTDVKFERNKDALDVVAVALFRNPKGRSWYTIFELPPDPGKGACGLNVDCPEGGQCDTGPVLNPRYSVWIEQSRVDVGDDHLDDYPEDGGRTTIVHLTSGAPASGGGSPASPTPAGS